MRQMNVNMQRLRTAAEISWKVECESIVTISPETCIEDLIYCIRTNPKKIAKRIRRLEICMKYFPNISDSLKQRGIETIAEFGSNATSDVDGLDEEYFTQLHNIEEFLCTSTDTKIPFFIESDSDPANTLFNEQLKKFVNCDGQVYKIFAQVVVIALSLMKSTMGKSYDDEYTKQAVRDMKIVFKGGAAMGHFLFREPKIWETMSVEDQEYVNSSCINGGDNDTSLVFENDVDDDLRGSLLQCYMTHVAEVLSVFRVEKLVQKYIRQAESNAIVCFSDEFFIHSCKRRSYDIVDFVEGIKTLSFHKHISKSNLYFTHSKCSFDTRDGRSDFYLSRIKAAFQVYSTNSLSRWNKKISCNAECLDVSVATSKDVRPFIAVYTHVNFTN